MSEFDDFAKEAVRYQVAADRIAKYGAPGQYHLIGLKHLRTAVEALTWCAEKEKMLALTARRMKRRRSP